MRAQLLRPRFAFPAMLTQRLPFLLLAVLTVAAVPLPRDALWVAVRSCLLAQGTLGTSFPCLTLQAATGDQPGHAVLPDPSSKTHIIVTPVTHISGIESPELLKDAAGAYWLAALASRRLVVERGGGQVPINAVGLALNSMETRSQDQLHIHADCFRPDVMAALRAGAPDNGSGWHPLRGRLEGDAYFARIVGADEIAATNMFSQLAARPGSHGDLSRSKVLLVESGQPDRFILAVTNTSRRTIESLLDDACSSVLRQAWHSDRKAEH